MIGGRGRSRQNAAPGPLRWSAVGFGDVTLAFLLPAGAPATSLAPLTSPPR